MRMCIYVYGWQSERAVGGAEMWSSFKYLQESAALEGACSKLAVAVAEAAEAQRLNQEAVIMSTLNARQQDTALSGLQSELIR